MALATLVIVATCSWSSPGANRFLGDPAQAIEHYTDIPSEVRAKLSKQVAAKAYTDIIELKRDSVSGSYEPELFDMHFGSKELCKQVDRAAWKPEAKERAMIFCDSGYCVALPTVCGNLSRIRPKSAALKQDSPGGDSQSRPMPLLLTHPVLMPSLLSQPDLPAMAPALPQVKASVLTPERAYEPVNVYWQGAMTVMPEPSSWLLIAVGTAFLAYRGLSKSVK